MPAREDNNNDHDDDHDDDHDYHDDDQYLQGRIRVSRMSLMQTTHSAPVSSTSSSARASV